MITDADIVIVGGGAAGVAAARTVAAAGQRSILLEASAWLGGRALTQRLRGLDLDLGCGWMHSADRNAWTALAMSRGVPIDQSPPAWGQQFRDLGFTPAEQAAAHLAFDRWVAGMQARPPPSDSAADLLTADEEWSAYVRAVAGFISGAPLERLSVADYLAYDEASTEANWRLRSGYGALVASSFPAASALHLSTPVTGLELLPSGVGVQTNAGSLRARAVILTVSTNVLASERLQLPRELAPWREAAEQLPLGHNEKLFFEVTAPGAFEPETQVYGNPRDAGTGAYYLRPFGRPLIEGFFGGEAAQRLTRQGAADAFGFATDQLVGLFGAEVRGILKPLALSAWSHLDFIGGSYSHALPMQADARRRLAQAYDNRVFFAGEATSRADFSTAHGAHDSGVRAAQEALRALAS